MGRADTPGAPRQRALRSLHSRLSAGEGPTCLSDEAEDS